MGIIYEILCWTTGLRYIGQTIQTLKERLRQHLKNKNGSSKLVLEHGNYEIYELEKVEDESLLREREKYYIQHTDCVNIYIGDLNKNQRNSKYYNSKTGQETRKSYTQTERVKEKHRLYQKAYLERKKLEKSRLLTNDS